MSTKVIPLVFIVAIICFAIGYKAHTPPIREITLPVPVDRIVEQIPKSTVFHLDISDIKADLQSYSHLSDKHRQLILASILSASEQYDINPLILYSIIYTESTFRWWLVHAIPKTKDKEPAIGLGGIRYSIWGDKLKVAGIVEVKSDLFEIKANIQAIAYIYDFYRKQELLPGATSADMSAMLRYFGGNHLEYFTRIDSKINSLLREKLYR